MLNSYSMEPRAGFVKSELKSIGISFRKSDAGDYRVNYRNGVEATAYYTDSLQDALDTGRAMCRKYGEAYAAAQAGGMSNGDCHEFATDQATR